MGNETSKQEKIESSLHETKALDLLQEKKPDAKNKILTEDNNDFELENSGGPYDDIWDVYRDSQKPIYYSNPNDKTLYDDIDEIESSQDYE